MCTGEQICGSTPPSVSQCLLSALLVRPFQHHLLKDFRCTTATVGSGIRSHLLIAMTVFPPTGGSTVLRCGERVRRQARTDLPSHDAKAVRNTAYSTVVHTVQYCTVSCVRDHRTAELRGTIIAYPRQLCWESDLLPSCTQIVNGFQHHSLHFFPSPNTSIIHFSIK